MRLLPKDVGKHDDQSSTARRHIPKGFSKEARSDVAREADSQRDHT